MANVEELKAKIDASDKSFGAVCKETGISRRTLYNKLDGMYDFKASEIVSLAKALGLTTAERDEIFLQ